MNSKKYIAYLLILVLLIACVSLGQVTSPIKTPVSVSTFTAKSSETAYSSVTAVISPTALPTFTLSPTVTSTPVPTQPPPPTPTPPPLSVSIVTIPAPSLKANVLDEPAEQAIEVYLPPSYANSQLHYPVVYFLPGFGSNSDGNNNFFPVDEIATLMANKQISEMILVVPNGANILHGSFYVNSPVTGNWEDFIVNDVIKYVDSQYRTIPKPEGRAIGGHSMGGFGAFNLAMHHPDIFSAAYSLSPTFLKENGLGTSLMFDRENKSINFLEAQKELASLPDDKAIKKMTTYEGALGFTLAYGAAIAPHPELGPPFFDYPMQNKNGELQKIPAIWTRWENGIGGWRQKIEKYHA